MQIGKYWSISTGRVDLEEETRIDVGYSVGECSGKCEGSILVDALGV